MGGWANFLILTKDGWVNCYPALLMPYFCHKPFIDSMFYVADKWPSIAFVVRFHTMENEMKVLAWWWETHDIFIRICSIIRIPNPLSSEECYQINTLYNMIFLRHYLICWNLFKWGLTKSCRLQIWVGIFLVIEIVKASNLIL